MMGARSGWVEYETYLPGGGEPGAYRATTEARGGARLRTGDTMGRHLLVVDGHHVVREALAEYFRSVLGASRVSRAASGEAALEMLRNGARRPELVIMDLKLDGSLHGLDLAERLCREWPGLPVVVLTNCHRPAVVRAALKAGVRAYLLKSCTVDELEAAVEAVLDGGRYLSPQLPAKAGDAPDPSVLSPRERQVLTLIARGGTTKSIASDLGISPKTVEKHRGKISQKLGLNSVAQLTRLALDHELV